MSHAYTFATTKDTGDIALQMTLYVIAMHVNVETGKTYCGIKTLMREARVKSDRTMRNYIKRLADDGFIKRERRVRANGGKTSDLIELVGFLEWRARDGISTDQVAEDAARFTGGSVKRRPLQPNLPDPSGKQATGPSGRQATGLTNTTLNRNINTQRSRAQSFNFDLKREVKAPIEGPSPQRVATARRQRGDAVVDAALDAIKSQKFKFQRDADRAFTQSVANAVLRNRLPPPEPVQIDLEEVIAEKVA